MSIVDNRKAFHDYFIEERYEAGIALAGWEVKAIRAGRAQIGEAYVMVRSAELYLIGAHISPLPTVSTHFVPDPTRTRKLLMHAEEIRRLIGKVEQRGYSLIPLNLHYAKGRIKLDLALARGKLKYDKRADEREREWNREKQRLLGEVVGADGKAVEELEELLGEHRIGGQLAHHDDAQSIGAALQAVLLEQREHLLGFIYRTHERHHQLHVGEAERLAHLA